MGSETADKQGLLYQKFIEKPRKSKKAQAEHLK